MDLITIRNPGNIVPDITGMGMQVPVESLADVTDGYHTIAELYDHRITLFIALCKQLKWSGDLNGCDAVIPVYEVWRSKKHGDGKDAYDGWFIMGIGKHKGSQISYHIPLSRWEETDFAETLEQAPPWDGHTSNDVLNRLKEL